MTPTPTIPEAEWSGFDHSGYPVFTLRGKLFRRLPKGDKELADFNDLDPKPTDAPVWAKTPLPTFDVESSNQPIHRTRKKRR